VAASGRRARASRCLAWGPKQVPEPRGVASFAKPTFERLRGTRHAAQYFDPAAAPITNADAEWGIDKAAAPIRDVRALLSATLPARFL
jgi:hypothetical protein